MDVFNLRYMKRIRFTLRSVGAWPNHVFQDSSATRLSVLTRYGYTSFLCTICCFGTLSQVMYVIKNIGIVRFIDLGQTCLTILMCFVYIQRTLLPIQAEYQAGIEAFATKFHLMHHKMKTDFSAKMHNKVTNICEFFVTVQHVVIYVTVCSYNLAPLYSNFKSGMLGSEKPTNGTYQHSVDYVLPFNHHTKIWYPITCIYNLYVSYNLACIFVCQDLLMCVFVFHIWGHLNIFKHNLNHFPTPRVSAGSKTVPLRYSAEESEEVAVGLKEIFVQYLMIKKFVANTSNTYSFTLCVYFVFHLVSDCILLLECSTMEIEALVKYAFLTVAIFAQLIQLSVVFELISSKGDSLADAVYGLPWECMDAGSRRTVLMLLQVVQQSLALKACNMVPVGVQTMLAIVKASLSYFVMLKTFANN